VRSTACVFVCICLVVCDIETLEMREPNRELGCCAIGKKLIINTHTNICARACAHARTHTHTHISLFRTIYTRILIYVSAGLSHYQGEADTRGDACMGTQIHAIATIIKNAYIRHCSEISNFE